MYPAFGWSKLLATMRDSRVPVLKNGPALKASFFTQASGTPLDCSVMKTCFADWECSWSGGGKVQNAPAFCKLA
jgi:hypothetical protein